MTTLYEKDTINWEISNIFTSPNWDVLHWEPSDPMNESDISRLNDAQERIG